MSDDTLFQSGGEQAQTDYDTNDPDLRKIARWVAEVVLYDREARTWDKRAKKIERRYKDERSAAEGQRARFNILWSNVQTLLPALYARNPKPDIQRRFKDRDPVGRVASDILERCVSFFVDTDAFAATARSCVLDYLLGGRGTTWIRYVPHMRAADIEISNEADEDEDTNQAEIVEFEEVVTDFVCCEDFGHNICRTWDEVSMVWRKVYMTRRELVKRFGKKEGNLPPLDYKQKDDRNNTIDTGVGKSTIYELWDKERGLAVWFHKDIPECLDLRQDPLKLVDFFPCPKPILANLANDSLIPVPDYSQYQDQAIELDALTSRITAMTKALKVAGVYDASAEGLDRLLSEGTENKLIPIQNWAIMGEKGGLTGAMSMLPVDEIAQTILALFQARDKVLSVIYEVTGIADIIRGNSQPEETAAAQEIKSSFATQRISDRQREVQRFVRGNIRILVNVVANHFQLDTIKQISGVRLFTEAEKIIYKPQAAAMNGAAPSPSAPPSMPPGAGASTAPPPVPGAQPPMPQGAPPMPMAPPPPPLPKDITPDQMMQMLNDPSWEEIEALIRNNALRSFRIDIETDSTIKADEEAEKSSRMEFVQTIGQLVQQSAQAPPEMAPFLAQVVMFVARAFPVGKDLEGTLNVMIQALEKKAANPQPPPPSPEMQLAQAQIQLEQAKAQSDAQLQQAKMQADAQIENQKMQNEIAIEKAKLDASTMAENSRAQAKAATDQHLNEIEMQRKYAEMDQQERMAQNELNAKTNLELQLAYIKKDTAIEVARISAKAIPGDVEEARAESQEASVHA